MPHRSRNSGIASVLSLTPMYRQNTPDMSHDVFVRLLENARTLNGGVGRGDVGAGTLARCRCDERGVPNRQLLVLYPGRIALFFTHPTRIPVSRRDASRRLCACRAPRGDARAGPSPSRAGRGARIATREEKPRDRPSRARPRNHRRRRRGVRRPHRRVRSSRRGRAPGRSVLPPVRARAGARGGGGGGGGGGVRGRFRAPRRTPSPPTTCCFGGVARGGQGVRGQDVQRRFVVQVPRGDGEAHAHGLHRPDLRRDPRDARQAGRPVHAFLERRSRRSRRTP